MYNILICDDEKDIVSALSIYLSTENYNIFTAYTGQEALDIVAKHDIHLILMDIMMPQMDGIAATVKLRETSNIPIILLTAKSEDSDKILGLNIGADDYITKPFNPIEVLARVRSQQHLTALQGGDGGNAVNEVRLRHRDGGGSQDDQLIDIGGGGTGKHIAARLHSLHKALAHAQVADLDPVAHQRAHTLTAELSAGAALQHLGSGIYIVETTEGLLNAAPTQKRIS